MSPFAVKCKQPVVTCIDRIWQILTACFLRSTHCDRGKLGQALGLQLEAESPTGIWEMRRRSDGSDGRSRCLYALQCEMPRWYQGRRHPRHGAAYRNLSKMHCVLHLFTGRWDSERPESTDASFQEGASYISTIWRLYPMFAGRSTIVYLHLSSFIHLKNTWIWVYIISHYNCKSRKSPIFHSNCLGFIPWLPSRMRRKKRMPQRSGANHESSVLVFWFVWRILALVSNERIRTQITKCCSLRAMLAVDCIDDNWQWKQHLELVVIPTWA